MNLYLGGEEWRGLFSGSLHSFTKDAALELLETAVSDKSSCSVCLAKSTDMDTIHNTLIGEGYIIKRIDHIAVIRGELCAIQIDRDLDGHPIRKMEFPLDKALFAWDCNSPDTLTDILLGLDTSASLVLLTRDASVHSVNDIDDIRKFLHRANKARLTPDSLIPADSQLSIVEECVPSEETRAYLATQRLTKQQAIKLVLGAPITLSRKVDILMEYRCYDDPLHELIDLVERGEGAMLPHDHWKRIMNWSFEENELAIEYAGGIGHPWFDESSRCIVDIASRMFLDASDGKEVSELPFGDDTIFGRGYLDIPQPFGPGDIVALDCGPFAKPTNAILLAEDGDSSSTPILYRSRPGVWALSRVNIGRKWGDEHEKMSPLYRLERADGQCVEKILLKLRNLIAEDEEAARIVRELARQMAIGDELSDLQMMDILKTLNNRLSK